MLTFLLPFKNAFVHVLFFSSEMNNCIKIEKHEKDEKSSPKCTNLIKKTEKPSTKQGGLSKKTKGLYMYNEPGPCRPNPKVCKLIAVKLNYTKRIRFKNACTISPKRNIKLKRIPHQLQRPPSILKNPSVPLSNNPQQRETCYPLESLAFVRIPKTLEGDHHHIANIVWLNPLHLRMRKDPMPQPKVIG